MKLGVVNFRAEAIFDRLQIWPVGICGYLRTANDAVGGIAHEIVSRILATVAHVVRHAQLRVCINRCPRPNVSPSGLLLLRRYVLFLRADIRPNFVALQTADTNITHMLVVICSAHTTHLAQQPRDGVLRGSGYPQGLGAPYLTGQEPCDLPVLSSPCFQGVSSPAAYSFNFTVVPHGPLGYLTVWPAGQSQPLVSTLNAPTGTVVANAAIVPGSMFNGDIEVFASNDTDLVVDVNGYFAAPGQGGLSLYPVTPCRVLDTRNANGAFVGELTVDVVDSVCAPSDTAQAYVFNATIVPSGPLGYLTLWPYGEPQPAVATLNAIDGSVTSNMAIVPTVDGCIDAYASNLTQLVLDISSYFAP